MTVHVVLLTLVLEEVFYQPHASSEICKVEKHIRWAEG